MDDSPASSAAASDQDRWDEWIATLEAEFAVAMGRPDRVAAACARIRDGLRETLRPTELARLISAASLLRQRGGAVAEPLFALCAELSRRCAEPWPLMRRLLEARDPSLALRAVDLLAECAKGRRLPAEVDLVGPLAELLERHERLASDRGAVETIGRLLENRSAPDDQFLLRLLAEDPRRSVRRLAATVLDLPGRPVEEAAIRRLLGEEAAAVLGPYLIYTRASHRDLLDLAATNAVRETAASFARAADRCGVEPLREAISELGWSRVNLGLDALPCVGLSMGGAFPLLLSPEEAAWLEKRLPAQRVFEKTLLVAHGAAEIADCSTGGNDAVARFRRYNLAHAEVLVDILDVAPLSPPKVRRIIERMDRVVADFVALFQPHWEECAALPAFYEGLKATILARLETLPPDEPLSAELTRLVQAFEDPPTLAEVRTLHGLKRYLHQRGLRLGFRLVESGRATNRTLDLAATAPRRGWQVVRAVQYVDFEPSATRTEAVFERSLFGRPLPAAETPRPPWPVWIAAEGLARQLLFGQEKFPALKVFCYGNEVHYYASFGNHPAFIRIDYSPPQRGGMIDVEFFGVSKFELESHPAPDLDGIRQFFLAMEFDCTVDRTRVHARYDKERALNLGELGEKAGGLMRLVPYLMEVDWIIGSLEYSPEARRCIARAWAEFFVRHGVLPARQFLTADRRRILQGVRDEPDGPREVPWDGGGVYRDRFTGAEPNGVAALLSDLLREQGLAEEGRFANTVPPGPYQIALEATLLRRLRQAVAHGRVCLVSESGVRRPADCFQEIHEAERFAELLHGNDADFSAAACLAACIGPLERGLHFTVTGAVNGHEVQRAVLPLRGGALGLYVLRTADGLPALAFYTETDPLFRRRPDDGSPWTENARFDVAGFAALLRLHNYPVEVEAGASTPSSAAVRAALADDGPMTPSRSSRGERTLAGLRAASGRAVGRAVLAIGDRSEEDFDGAILVAPAVGPRDGPRLYRAAGVVSTGGGILSHAGLMAAQFRKPALIVSGQWRREPDGRHRLVYELYDYAEVERVVAGCRVTIRRDFQRREEALNEGDLVVVDADEGVLHVLGQDRDTLALHEELRRLREACLRLRETTAEPELLAWRGRRLRAVHHLEKLIGRLTEPALARHAVRELLLPEGSGSVVAARQDQDRLLRLFLANSAVGSAARESIRETAELAEHRRRRALAQATEDIPTSLRPYEVLALRLAVHREEAAVAAITNTLRACGLTALTDAAATTPDRVDGLARRQLELLRGELESRASAAEAAGELVRLRHLLRSLDRVDQVLRTPANLRFTADRLREALARHDAEATARCRDRRILDRHDSGLAIQALIGSKAANLAEVQHLVDPELVPPWFVVTDRAFRETLAQPVEVPAEIGPSAPAGVPLEEAIRRILADPGFTGAAKSEIIRRLWEVVVLPAGLADELRQAVRRLACAEDPAAVDSRETFFAVRSSGWEEDTETTARAGEFETFLFVRGEDSVLHHVRQVWSSFWTERAIHHRMVLGMSPLSTGGGVLVQRMVCSRVSGVLQTVNLPEEHAREMIINAGLGLGEGIVSGTVAADQIIVSRRGDVQTAPLRFRYLTADKREQVVFDRRRGSGTVRGETLYHQRMRAALDYVELCELVRAADRLEQEYGYPLDIEFGIEGQRLRLLQVRPLAIFAAVVRETVEKWPL